MKSNIIKPKFKIDQKVYWIVNNWTEKKCTLCKGTGKVLLKHRKYDCPKCGGGGVLTGDDFVRQIYKSECRVVSISSYQDQDNKIMSITYKISSFDKCKDYYDYHEITERSNTLFATEEEAKKEIRRLNALDHEKKSI